MTATRVYEPRRITPTVRAKVLSAGECAYCGEDESFGLVVDHIVPVAVGGSDSIENLTACCWRCNSEKSALAPDEWRAVREARGLPWPVPSLASICTALIALLPPDVTEAPELQQSESVSRAVYKATLRVRMEGADLRECAGDLADRLRELAR